MDLYPFVLSPKVIEKLTFIHDLARARGQEAKPASTGSQGRGFFGLRRRARA